jgi:hypothetical protein
MDHLIFWGVYLSVAGTFLLGFRLGGGNIFDLYKAIAYGDGSELKEMWNRN